MPEKKDNLVESLNQIKSGFQKQMEALEEIKNSADAELIPEIEQIERDGWQTILDIEELQKRQRRETHRAGSSFLGSVAAEAVFQRSDSPKANWLTCGKYRF